MDFGAALMGLFMALVVKVLVMVLAGVYLLRLYRVSHAGASHKLWLVVPQEHRRRFRLLTWGLVLFVASEVTCGIEIYILFRSSIYISTFHAIASSLGMALTALGIFEVLDWKYLHWRDTGAACVAVKSCRGCTKRTSGRCQYRSLLLLMGTFLVFTAVPIFFVSTAQLDADPRPYVLPFESWNEWYDHSLIPWLANHAPGMEIDGKAYHIPHALLYLEFRILPIVAIALAAAGIATMRLGRENAGLTLVLLATGPLAFSLFEVMTFGITRDAYLGGLLHEGGELFFIVTIAELLRRMFPPDAPRQAQR